MESIRSAAILEEGKSHAEILQTNNFKRSCGFFTTAGRFVGRVEAAKIAYEAGQILCDPCGEPLVSEELWEYDSYKWSEKKGYYKKE